MFEWGVPRLLAVTYLAAIAGGAWFVIPSERRRDLQGRTEDLISDFRRRLLGLRQTTVLVRKRSAEGLKHGTTGLMTRCQQHKGPLIAAGALFLTPLLLALLLTPNLGLDTYNDQSQPIDPVVAALLKGEQLVPPPPLPPDIFTNREVEAERNDIVTASRDWSALDGDFRQRLLTVYRLMSSRGYQMALLEGYRSAERQASLAKRGSHVTNAGAYQSYHQFGLAADSAFYRDGKLLISEKDPSVMEGYRLYGQYAESVGLVWGGRWQMMDLGHVELRRPYLLKRN